MGNPFSLPLIDYFFKSSKFAELFSLINDENIKQVEIELNCLKSTTKKICNQKNSSGATLLMAAVYYGNYEIIDLLIRHGANPKLKDNHGRTCLFYLINSNTSKKQDITKLLVQHMCPINEIDNKKLTCLNEAVKQNDNEMVKILLEEGADPHVADDESISPLHHAADNCNLEIIKLLLKKNLNVNQIDSNGFTALHISAMHNDIENVKILVSRGANINSKDFSSNTPLAFARHNNSKEAASYLRKNGAKEFTQQKIRPI